MHRWAGWFLLYLGITFVVLLPLSAHSGTRLPDDGDAVLGLWIVWSATHLSKGYPGIFDANAFYPHPQGLLYSEPMLSQGLMAWPLFRWLDNPVLAMNVFTMLTLALSGLAAHVLFRELTGSTVGAVAGAITYAYSAYSFSQLARIQLITLQWLPLALVCLHRYFARGRKAYLAGFAIFSALLGIACFYYLAFYLVGLAVLLPVFFWAFPEHRTFRSVAWVSGSGLAVGAVLAFVTIPYLVLYRHYAFTSEPASYDLLGYFVPRSENLLYRAFDVRPALVDHFIGYVVLLLAMVGLVALVRTRSRAERTLGFAYLATAALAFLLSAGPELRFAGLTIGPGPYAFLQKLGPYQNLRAPDRFSILVTLGLGVFVAFGAGRMLSRGGRLRRALGCGVVSALVLAEHWSPRRVQGVDIPTGTEVPDVYRWLEDANTGPIAELPPRPFREMRHVTMDAYFSTFHEKTILFNKPSFYPPAMELLAYELEGFPSRDAITLLRGIEVSHAVVHPKRARDDRSRTPRRRFPEMSLLKTFPDRDDPSWSRFRLGGEELYALSPLEWAGTPRECDCREIPRERFTLDGSGVTSPHLATDGERTTKWSTGRSQKKGDFFEVAFDRPRRPVRIELELAFPYGEFPRHLEVNGFLGDHGWRLERLPDVWHKLALVRQLVEDPSKARLRIDFDPKTVDRIRLFINVTGEGGGRPWSIFELHVYEPADPDVVEFPAL